ncbi:DivIVA domain-containing protein [Metallumcola ferriviriculae]|uniref:DivIVA domain-containing protein n=1 Tax=Metallumcola ferriviriculae TaxID=3039180 RepID=A0AAU0UPA9_9FIRM|nr:DivIVA domain-containing protein [Desulfitibacteraceae bacterium MK1]
MLTPLDIGEKEFRRSIRGYNEEEVDNFLDKVLKDYEQLYKENLRLKQEFAEMEESLSHYRDLEGTLNKTLVLAQETADELRKNAEKEAEMLYNEARFKGEKIVSAAEAQTAKINEEQRRLIQQTKVFKAQFKAALLSQIELLEEAASGQSLSVEE